MNVKYREAIKLIRMEGPDALVEAVRAENERIRDSWRAGLLSDNQVEAALTLREPASSAVAVDPDFQAHEESPLWEPFRSWGEDHAKRVKADQRELVWAFLGDRTEESPGNDALP